MTNYTTRRPEEEFGEPILTKTIKAGRRTYFIDVRTTRDDDNFLTITESRKKSHPDGSVTYDRHKIFLYKEDFDKVSEGLHEVIEFVKKNKPEYFEQKAREEAEAKAL
ncbi:MAG: DUF3276 family protein [Rikenellaceae bacterium]